MPQKAQKRAVDGGADDDDATVVEVDVKRGGTGGGAPSGLGVDEGGGYAERVVVVV